MSLTQLTKSNLVNGCFLLIITILLFMDCAFASSVKRRGVCMLRGIGPRDGVIKGFIYIDQDGDSSGSVIRVEVSGLAPNATHGIHFHQYGDISDQFKGLSNGAHFAVGDQSDGARHGSPLDLNPRPHNGDLGNIQSDQHGRVSAILNPSPNKWVTLDGTGYSVIGRAAVIHELADDTSRTSTTGNAGGRFAQCVIGLENTKQDGVSEVNEENLAIATSIPSGSFISCTLAPLGDSTSFFSGADPGPNGETVPTGEVRFETNALGYVNIAGMIYGLPPSQRFPLYFHEFGSLQSTKSIGDLWHYRSSSGEAVHPHIKDMTSNCRGIAEYQDYMDGLKLPMTKLVGRTLAIHKNLTDSSSPVIAACVLGIASLSKKNPIARRSMIPRTECILEPTSGYPNLKGRFTINSTDEYDCNVQIAAHQITGVPTLASSSSKINQLFTRLLIQIHEYGDIIDVVNAGRLGGKLLELAPISANFTTLDGLISVKSNSILPIRLSGVESVLGRGLSLSIMQDDGSIQENITPLQRKTELLAQCVLGASDFISMEEKLANLPNKRISQKNSTIESVVAHMSPTYFYPPAVGQIWLHQVNENAIEVNVGLLVKPLTNYTIRIYNHGSIRSKLADNFPSDRLLAIIRPTVMQNSKNSYTFLSDAQGYIRTTAFLNVSSLGGNSPTPLHQTIGMAVLVQPVYDEIVLPAVGFGVFGSANPEHIDPPSIQNDERVSLEESNNDNLPIIGAAIGGTLGFAILASAYLFRRYRKKVNVLVEKEKTLAKMIQYSELQFGHLLGAGSFGEVYSGTWRGTEVAIKQLNVGKVVKKSMEEFDHEVSVMIELRHPNLVLYMAACAKPPHFCIVLEYMLRGSLYDALRDESLELTMPMKLSFLLDSAKGLQYLHTSTPPIFHRDLKSPNILLDSKWNCKISDFGLSGVSTSAEQGNPPGTLLWMAPEIIEGSNYSTKADVYSYGIIMWEVFTRREPYEDVIAEVVTFRVCSSNLRPTIHDSDQIPDDILILMKAAWSQNKDERPEFCQILKHMSLNNQVKQNLHNSSFLSLSHSYENKVRVHPPHGSMALVFTGVQNSSSLWERCGSGMEDALNKHNEIIRGAISRNKGYEVKTEGDSFMIAFSSIENAVLFALQSQEMLNTARWPDSILHDPSCSRVFSKNMMIFNGLRVRMGIHWGEPICKEDVVTGRMDYFGPVVNVTSRIGNYPQGGRIALSECAFELIQDKLEELGSPYTREIGDKMLKGISTPIKLFEMIPESLVDRITYLEEFVSLTESFTQDQMEGRVEDKFSSDSPMEHWEADYEDIQMSAKQLGSGSFGVVFLAEFKGQQVAVKKFMKQKMSEKQYYAFLSEIMIIRQVKHDNILHFYGACIKQPNLCLIVEYAPHGSLQRVLSDTKILLSFQQQMSMVIQITDAMAFLHSQKPPIIHRDLKSENILLTGLNPVKIKIGDFGLARIKMGNQTMTKCGTRAWIAPEVLKGSRYDESADVFSFGIVMWEIFTRELPYVNVDPMKLTFEIANGLRPTIPPSLKPELKNMMSLCWQDDPTKRPSFQTLSEEWKIIHNI